MSDHLFYTTNNIDLEIDSDYINTNRSDDLYVSATIIKSILASFGISFVFDAVLSHVNLDMFLAI